MVWQFLYSNFPYTDELYFFSESQPSISLHNCQPAWQHIKKVTCVWEFAGVVVVVVVVHNVYDVNDLSIKKDKHWAVKYIEIFCQSKQHSC